MIPALVVILGACIAAATVGLRFAWIPLLLALTHLAAWLLTGGWHASYWVALWLSVLLVLLGGLAAGVRISEQGFNSIELWAVRALILLLSTISVLL